MENETKVRSRPNLERAILKACLSDEDAVLETASLIKPEYFLVDVNRFIYFSVDYLWSKGVKPTPILIIESFKDEKTRRMIEDFGGVSYIDAIMSQPKESSVKELCKELKENYEKWRVVDLCENSTQNLIEKGDLKKTIQNLSSELDEIITSSSNEVHTMGTGLKELLKYRTENQQEVSGLEVGWSKYDTITGGARPGDLIVVVARAKTGKSNLLMNWATNLVYDSNIPVLYIDTEMDSREQEDRVLSILSEVPYQEILNGKFSNDDEKAKKVKQAVDKMSKGKLYHTYLPTFSIEETKAIIKKYKRQHDVQAVFFDYIKIPSSGLGTSKNTAEYQALGFLTTALKELAGELQIPIWTAAQENRNDVNGTNKDASNVGGSDRILMYATKMMFLYNKDPAEIEGLPELGSKQLLIKYQRAGINDAPPINIKLINDSLKMEEVKI